MTFSKLLVGAVAVLGLATLGPAALAAERPDDQAGLIGVGGAVATEPGVIVAYGTADTVEARIKAGLDARTGLPVASTAVRPDDRPGTIGVGSVPVTAPSVRPDDRPGIIGVGSIPTVEPAVRPDDRGGPIGVGRATPPVAATDGVGVPTATAEPPGVVPATGQPGSAPAIDWTTSWTIALIAAVLAAVVGFIAAYKVEHRPVGPRMTRGPGGTAVSH